MKKLLILLTAGIFTFFTACDSEDSTGPDQTEPEIPADPVNQTIPTPTINNLAPTASFSKSGSNPSRIQMNLSGITNPTTGDPIQLNWSAEGGNIYITEDGVPQGVLLTKVGSGGTTLAADVVFLVDNSGSMGEESDSVAASIIKFANALEASGLIVKFGCVGQWGDVNGAINLTDASSLEHYLNGRTSYYGDTVSGTNRTEGFYGSDSADLHQYAYNMNYSYSENNVTAAIFADAKMNWTAGAQRVFISFTDESTQPDGDSTLSTAWFCQNLAPNYQTHTVWSGGDTATAYTWSDLSDERPWAMSWCSGGTIKLIPSDAAGLDLSTLPVTGALSNSYLVEYLTDDPNATHTVKITIVTTSADGERTYEDINY